MNNDSSYYEKILESIELKTKKTVLFTGAGFTKNFGGLLGRELWAQIFNSKVIQENKRIRKHLIERLDYEDAYEKILDDDNLNTDEKKSFKDALFAAYVKQDKNILEARNWRTYLSGLNTFLKEFAGVKDNKGFFFTTNQDIFIERYYDIIGTQKFNSPTVIEKNNTPLVDNPFDQERNVLKIPNEKISKEYFESYFHCHHSLYIKLHGSFNWMDPTSERILITGRKKLKNLEHIELLKVYLALFKKVLEQDDMKLLIVGYSFGDSHINKIIVDAVKKNNLRIYVISPEPINKYLMPETAIQFFEDSENANNVLEMFDCGLAGYFEANFVDIIPNNVGEPRVAMLGDVRKCLSS